MLDTELREQLLEGYYAKRKSRERLPPELEKGYSQDELIRISKQLEEKGLIDLELHTSEDGTVVLWDATLTAQGIEYVESDTEKESEEFNIEINDSQNIQVGNRNTQIIESAFQEIINRIDDESASKREKQQAKSKLAQFLGHPLVVSVVGDLITQIPELQQYLPE